MAGPLTTYAAARGLQVAAGRELPPVTPLLGRGDQRLTKGVVSGVLPGGVEGELAHFTYVDLDDDGPDRRYPQTVVLTEARESIGFVPRLCCTPRAGFTGFSIPGLAGGDTMRAPDRRVELESEALEQKYTIRVDPEVGDNWVRQLFSPGFIAWLTHDAPADLCFELDHGALCVYVPGTLETPADLDRLCGAAAEVSSRIRGEALEEEGRAEAGAAAQPDRPEESLSAKIERGLAEVEWPRPPADAATAIRAYRRPSMAEWEPWVYGAATLIGGLLLGLLLLLADEADGIFLVLGAPFVAAGVWGKFVSDRAGALGKAAFARGYSQSRTLQLENPRLFQARHMRLSIPGTVEWAMSGVLPGSDRPGAVLFSHSKKGAARADHNVVVAQLPDGVVVDPGQAGEGVAVAQHERVVAIHAPSAGDSKRTADEVDGLVARAVTAIERAAQPGRVS